MERLKMHSWEDAHIGKVGGYTGFKDYLMTYNNSISDSKGEHVISLEDVIITHEDHAEKKYAGKILTWKDKKNTSLWWIAIPSEQHTIQVHSNSHHYRISPVEMPQENVEEALNSDIPEQPFFENKDADEVAKFRIMRCIVAWQDYRRQARW